MVAADRPSAHLHDLLRSIMQPVTRYLGAALFYDALRFVRERELEDDLVFALVGGEVEAFLDRWGNKTAPRLRFSERFKSSG